MDAQLLYLHRARLLCVFATQCPNLVPLVQGSGA